MRQLQVFVLLPGVFWHKDVGHKVLKLMQSENVFLVKVYKTSESKAAFKIIQHAGII